MADEKDKAKDKKKRETLRDQAEELGGTVVNSGGNMGAGKSGEIVLGGTEPVTDDEPGEDEQKG
ncbi:MAG: hypothetical protein H0W76_25305 [Pyrinomonadaceae bacterium]|nr:hypothetical protein [Pyrinomonadaceae bacterium]